MKRVDYENSDQLELISQALSHQPFGNTWRDMDETHHSTRGTEQGSLSGRSAEPPRSAETVEHHSNSSETQIRPDTRREQRKGAPEVIFGETKETAQIIAMAQGLLAGSGRAIISRMPSASVAPVREA